MTPEIWYLLYCWHGFEILYVVGPTKDKVRREKKAAEWMFPKRKFYIKGGPIQNDRSSKVS